jgi:hypothetical protein
MFIKALLLCALSEQSERALKAEAGDWGLSKGIKI